MALKRKNKPAKAEPSSAKGTSADSIKRRIQPVTALAMKVAMLVYGRSGTGKTTFAATMLDVIPKDKKVLLIDAREEGQDSVAEWGERLHVLPAYTWDDILGAYWYLKESEHEYGGVIIDTITQVQGLAMAWAKKKAKTPEMMSRRAWGFLSSALNPLLLDFRDLPIHTVFLAQDRRSANDLEDEDISDMLPDVGPAMIPSVAKDVNAMVKVIGQTYIQRREVRKGKKIVKRTEFRMRVGPHPVFITKIRSPKSSKVPSSISDPTFTKIVQIMKGEYK